MSLYRRSATELVMATAVAVVNVVGWAFERALCAFANLTGDEE
jgi:hypothetical protein